MITIPNVFSPQAVCEYGRDSIESLGRRRRSVSTNQTESEEDMTLSQEILVLDFGDEKQSEFLRQEASTDFGKGLYLRRLAFTFCLLML